MRYIYTLITFFLFFFSGCSTTGVIGSDSNSTVRSLEFVPAKLLITGQSQNFDLKVVALDQNGNGIASTITITQLVDSSGIDYGDFNLYNTTASTDGVANFILTSPKDEPNLKTKVLYVKAKHSDGSVVTKELNIEYNYNCATNGTDCSSAGASVSNVLDSIITVPSKITITSPNEEIDLKIYTLNASSQGISSTISISQIIDTSGKDFGDFASYSIVSATGITTVKYTAPSSQPDINKSVIISAVDITGQSVSKALEISYAISSEFENLYKIYPVVPSKLSIATSDIFSFKIGEINNQNAALSATDISDFSVRITNSNMASIKKDNGVYENLLTYNGVNPLNAEVLAKTKAGILALEVNATIYKGTQKEKKLSQVFTASIASGPVSALSIVKDVTSSVYSNGLFSETYTVHAVDSYGNKANDGDSIYVGVVNFDKDTDSSGTGILNNKTFTYTTNSGKDFTNTKVFDKFVINATENKNDYNYTGSWDISTVDSVSQITLVDSYSGYESSLSYITGNEYRYNKCSLSQSVVDVDSQDATYAIKDGVAKFDLRYDPYMVGKNVYIYANLNSGSKRVGSSIKQILKGTGWSNPTTTFTAGTTGGALSKRIFFPLAQSGLWLENNDVVVSQTLGDCNITTNTNMKTECDGSVDVKVSLAANTSCTIEVVPLVTE